MRIAMFTNNYLPFIGGSALSVHRFSQKLRAFGHEVLVVAPEFDGELEDENPEEVFRVAALKNFNHSQFSVPLPLSVDLSPRIQEFDPDVIHAHHPFFLGDTALRIAASLDTPIVATHHTEYQHYIHYLPEQFPWMATFVQEIASGHANLCDANIAPSEDIRAKMYESGVVTPVVVIPTGVDLDEFAAGDRSRGRADLGVPESASLIGHVGRIAPEKNLTFLLDACLPLLESEPDMWLAVVGEGPSLEELQARARDCPVADRIVFAGRRTGPALVDAYHAMDVFVFSSYSETQGMVLLEAMAAGAPVVALDAPGVRDVVKDGANGRLLAGDDPAAFAGATREVLARRDDFAAGVRQSAEALSLEATTQRLVALYEGLVEKGRGDSQAVDESPWEDVLRRLKREWEIWQNRIESAVEAMSADEPER